MSVAPKCAFIFSASSCFFTGFLCSHKSQVAEQLLLTFCRCALLQDLVNKYSAAVNNQRSKVTQLEQDQRNLSDDISSLKDEVEGQQTVPGIFFFIMPFYVRKWA